MLGENHSGLHSWVEIKGAIVDISIQQERDFFDFGKYTVVIGELPKGMEFYGHREVRKTPKDYARDAAKKMGMKVHDWIAMHKRSALNSYQRYLEKELEHYKMINNISNYQER